MQRALAPSVIALLMLCAVPSRAEPVQLPAQAGDRHLGVASCASSVCHGAVESSGAKGVRLNEYVTWAHDDAHARAYEVLLGARARGIAARLGLPSAQTTRICLDCHADNVPVGRRGPKFTLTDGVGCEACHGGAERWLATHSSLHSTYQKDVALGMYPSADLPERARLCASCHLGDADNSMTHRILGAGHPRLSFELDTFQALEPPHYDIDADYRARKTVSNHLETWALGQVQLGLQQLQLLQVHMKNAATIPELAQFDCVSCHGSSMHRAVPAWHRRSMTEDLGPGTVPLDDAHWRMSMLLAQALDAGLATQIRNDGRALQRATLSGGPVVVQAAAALAVPMQQLRARVRETEWTNAARASVLSSLLQAGADGEFSDYLGAEQAVMGIDLLLIESGQAQSLRLQRDALFKLTRHDEEFDGGAFREAIVALRAALR